MSQHKREIHDLTYLPINKVQPIRKPADRSKRNQFYKHDCFAFKNYRCTALTEMTCKKGSCNFYKTLAEFEAGCTKLKGENKND